MEKTDEMQELFGTLKELPFLGGGGGRLWKAKKAVTQNDPIGSHPILQATQ